MNKREYLDLLKFYLKDLPKNIVDDIVFDYEEHFRIGMESGKTEAQISDELGSPEIIANHFLENEGRPRAKVNVEKEKRERNPIMIALAILGLIVLSPVIITIGALIVSIIAVIASIFVGIVAFGVGMLMMAGGIVVSLIPVVALPSYIAIPLAIRTLHPITSICLVVGLICFSIVLVSLSIKFIQWICKGIKNIILSINWKMEKRLNKDER